MRVDTRKPPTCIFLANVMQVGLAYRVLMSPPDPVVPPPALHLVEDQERLALVREAPQTCREKLRAKVPISALALDRFDQDRGNSMGALVEGALDGPRGLLRPRASRSGFRR